MEKGSPLPLPAQDSHHDLAVAREGELWRRIPCSQTEYDPQLGRKRPSTAAFDDWKNELGDTDPISAFIALKCQTPATALDGHEGFGLIMVTEELVTNCNLQIVEKEVPGPPGHVLLVGRKTYSVRKKLAREAAWVIPCP